MITSHTTADQHPAGQVLRSARCWRLIPVTVTKPLPFGCLVEAGDGVPGLLRGVTDARAGDQAGARIESLGADNNRVALVRAWPHRAADGHTVPSAAHRTGGTPIGRIDPCLPLSPRHEGNLSSSVAGSPTVAETGQPGPGDGYHTCSRDVALQYER
ncbi:MAG TPA: hypothetical protein DHU96_26580 [Actinobacteria bacterium]|nr:hypothetical protein [Actinomycetota bacterium]